MVRDKILEELIKQRTKAKSYKFTKTHEVRTMNEIARRLAEYNLNSFGISYEFYRAPEVREL